MLLQDEAYNSDEIESQQDGEADEIEDTPYSSEQE